MSKKLKEIFKSPHVQMSIATGISILTLAYFSKHVLDEPISYLHQAAPPFIMTIYEAVLSKNKGKKITTTWYWVTAILLSTAIIILVYWL